MALTKRTFYPADAIIAEWTDLVPIVSWAKAKPEDVEALGVAMGEDELPFEALAGLPDEMLLEAFTEWVTTNKPGQIAQVKVGMVVNAVRLKLGADLIDPLPKKKANVPAVPAAPDMPGMSPTPPSQQQRQQQVEEQQQQQLQQHPFVPPGTPRAVVDLEADHDGGMNARPGSLPDIPMGEPAGEGNNEIPLYAPAKVRTASLAITVQLSTVVDQGMGQEIPQLPNHKLDELRARYVEFYGQDPLEDADPSDKQLTMLAWKLEAGLNPYVDFGVWCPFGVRAERRMRFENHIFKRRTAPTVQWRCPARVTWKRGGHVSTCTRPQR